MDYFRHHPDINCNVRVIRDAKPNTEKRNDNLIYNLATIGKEKLNISHDVRIKLVLEEDGTEIDDEEYFMFLPHNTTLMFIQPGEKWALEVKGMLTHNINTIMFIQSG